MSTLAERVETVLKDCLYKDDEFEGEIPPADAVIAEGVLSKFAFHPERLASHKADIAALCNELPDNFQLKGGGGWTFLNLCMTKDGEHWGEHHNCEQLVVLCGRQRARWLSDAS